MIANVVFRELYGCVGLGKRVEHALFELFGVAHLEVDDLDEAMTRAWGRSLALVHKASGSFPSNPARPRVKGGISR